MLLVADPPDMVVLPEGKLSPSTVQTGLPALTTTHAWEPPTGSPASTADETVGKADEPASARRCPPDELSVIPEENYETSAPVTAARAPRRPVSRRRAGPHTSPARQPKSPSHVRSSPTVVAGVVP